MLPTASRIGPFLRSSFALALSVSLLGAGIGAGCSQGSETASHPAPAAKSAPSSGAPSGSSASGPAKSAAAAPAPAVAPSAAPKAADSQALASQTNPTPAAPTAQDPSGVSSPGVSSPGAGASGSTGVQSADAAAGAAAKTTDDSKAAADPAAKSPPPAFGSALTSAAAAGSPAAKAALAKAEAAAATKVGDPLSQDADPSSKAKLTYEFGTDSKNFGKCMQGDVLTHTFALQSSGEEDLVIKQAKPTCGCTVAQVATQQADGSMAPYNFGTPIPVGRKVEITATLHTQGKRGHAASRINIFSNDPRGQSQLGLEADVDPFFQVNPQSLNFNSLSARDTASDKITISTTRGEKVKLATGPGDVPQGMPPGLKIELNPADADAEGKATRWELVASLGPGLAEGNMAYTVGLKSDLQIPGAEKLPNGNPPTYEVSVPIMARITGMISYSPAFVSLGLIRPGQVVSRSVRVSSHDPEFKLGEPKVLIQGREGGEWELASRFSTVIRPVTGENSVDVEVRLDGMPESLNGSFSGMLDIQVGHPEKPDIKLPITGVCRGGATSTPSTQTPGQAPPPTPPK